MKYLLLLFISGCASSTTPDAFVPIGFSSQEIDSINGASINWAEKSNNKYFSIIDPNCSPDVCSTITKVHTVNVPNDIDGIDFGSGGEQDDLGACYTYVDIGYGLHKTKDCATTDNVIQYHIQIVDTVVSIDPNLFLSAAYIGKDPMVNLRTTVIHELGHSYKKKHIGENNVMFAYSGLKQADEITEGDLKDPN